LIEKESTRAGPDSVTGLKIVATASHHVVGENFSDLLGYGRLRNNPATHLAYSGERLNSAGPALNWRS
jgi:hypothetical protein